MCVPNLIPLDSNCLIAILPKATIGAVTLPEVCPPPR